MTQRIEIVDFLKGFAITAIVMMHLLEEYGLPKPISYAVQFGGSGVHAFFLCSGFGLFMSQTNRAVGFIEFLSRRFRKVYVSYAIIVTIIAIWDVLILNMAVSDTIIELLSHLLLFKMFFEGLNVSLCPTFWFISTIFQFYLLWPFILWLYRRKYGLLYAIIISIVWMAMMDKLELADNRVYGCFFLQFLWEFVLGMKLADMIKKRKIENFSPTWLMAGGGMVFGICGMGIMTIVYPSLKAYNDFFSLISICSAAFLFYKMGIKKLNDIFVHISWMSYEWYLVHYSMFLLCWSVYGKKTSFIVEVVSLLFISWIVGFAYHKVIKCIVR